MKINDLYFLINIKRKCFILEDINQVYYNSNKKYRTQLRHLIKLLLIFDLLIILLLFFFLKYIFF